MRWFVCCLSTLVTARQPRHRGSGREQTGWPKPKRRLVSSHHGRKAEPLRAAPRGAETHSPTAQPSWSQFLHLLNRDNTHGGLSLAPKWSHRASSLTIRGTVMREYAILHRESLTPSQRQSDSCYHHDLGHH